MTMQKILIRENLTKNVILITCLVLLFFPIQGILLDIDPSNIDSVLLFASLVFVAALFANFAFTYEFSDVENKYERLLGHATTFFVMLAIGLLLQVAVLVISIKVPKATFLFASISIIIYLASVLYDFWDIFRIYDDDKKTDVLVEKKHLQGNLKKGKNKIRK